MSFYWVGVSWGQHTVMLLSPDDVCPLTEHGAPSRWTHARPALDLTVAFPARPPFAPLTWSLLAFLGGFGSGCLGCSFPFRYGAHSSLFLAAPSGDTCGLDLGLMGPGFQPLGLGWRSLGSTSCRTAVRGCELSPSSLVRPLSPGHRHPFLPRGPQCPRSGWCPGTASPPPPRPSKEVFTRCRILSEPLCSSRPSGSLRPLASLTLWGSSSWT